MNRSIARSGVDTRADTTKQAYPPPARSMAVRTLLVISLVAMWIPTLHARTVYRCVRDATVSLSTAPEPGSQCEAHELDDNDPATPNLWGSMGDFSGQLYRYERAQGPYFSTRLMDGATPVSRFSASTPESTGHAGMGEVGRPRLDRFDAAFRAAAQAHGIDDAWVRAIAHAESYFDPAAISEAGAMGVMQLMPEVALEYGVTNVFDATESIQAGARHLRLLIDLYKGDLTLTAAAYNAGVGAVTRFEGVPPFPETQQYVTKVHALHARYREALGMPPLDGHLRPAIAGEEEGSGWAHPPPGGP